MTSSWEPEWAKTLEFQEEMANLKRKREVIERLTSWMNHIPLVGHYVAAFWFLLLDDGPRTLKPRWGGITFGYLNDGMKPTMWHTWRQVTHGQDDPYTGIYVGGAPKSLKQAQEWEEKWAAERKQPFVIEASCLPGVGLGEHDHSLCEAAATCDDCGRVDGTHNYEVEH